MVEAAAKGAEARGGGGGGGGGEDEFDQESSGARLFASFISFVFLLGVFALVIEPSPGRSSWLWSPRWVEG